MYVNRKEKLKGATIKVNGNMLEITGKVKKGFGGIVLPGFELEEIVTEGVQPTNPEDLAKAMALIE